MINRVLYSIRLSPLRNLYLSIQSDRFACPCKIFLLQPVYQVYNVPLALLRLDALGCRFDFVDIFGHDRAYLLG